MPFVPTVFAILTAARERLADPACWLHEPGQFEAVDSRGEWCPATSDRAVRWDVCGAVVAAAAGLPSAASGRLIDQALTLVAEALGIELEGRRAFVAVGRWFEAPTRTHADALRGLDGAIALAGTP